jgi:hypothetical protein
MTDNDVGKAAEKVANALLKLSEKHALLALTIARLTIVISEEAARTPRFASAVESALEEVGAPADGPDRPRRAGRRSPGVVDPFAILSEGGEEQLRQRLAELDLEQLRDIIAEHGMDHDRLAMKWKDPGRVIERIIERVAARSSKGTAFRTGGEGPPL